MNPLQGRGFTLNIKPYFLQNIKVKKIKCQPLQFLFGALRVNLPILTSPLLLYKVPKCGPDKDRNVYNFGRYGMSSGEVSAERMMILPRECPTKLKIDKTLYSVTKSLKLFHLIII